MNITEKFSQWWLKKQTVKEVSNAPVFSYIVKYSARASCTENLPMLVALHGDGDTVDGFYQAVLSELNVRARIVLIKGPIAHQMGDVWPFSAEQYLEYGKAFSCVVDQIAREYPTVNKPVLLGFSGGGAMAYYQAVKHGDSYSYIFPVSGLMSQQQLGRGLCRPSAQVYAYHGKTDEVVAFSAGKAAVKLLEKKGGDVTFTAFDGGHHGIFTDMKSTIIQAIEAKLNTMQ